MRWPFFCYFCAVKNSIRLIVFFLLMCATACAQGRYRPGETVPEPYLKVYGHERFFSIAPISDMLCALMRLHSVKMGEKVQMESMRYLRVLHRDAEGNAIVGEMVCNAMISNDLIEIFKALFEAGYPIEKMRLIDWYGGDDEASMRDNNSSCFNQRTITAGGKISRHSYGMAVDINPLYNPYYKVQSGGKVVVKPEEGVEYLDRNASFPYKIEKGDLCYRLFKQHGFRWGGEWASRKDYQHFER